MKKIFLLFCLFGIILSTPIFVNGQKTIIKCNPTYLPDLSWKIMNDQNDDLKFDLSKTELIPFDEQIKITKDLKDPSYVSACVLDYLLVHQDLIQQIIPKDILIEDFKKMNIVFLGTIYRESGDTLTPIFCARNIYWNGSEWDWKRSYSGDKKSYVFIKRN